MSGAPTTSLPAVSTKPEVHLSFFKKAIDGIHHALNHHISAAKSQAVVAGAHTTSSDDAIYDETEDKIRNFLIQLEGELEAHLKQSKTSVPSSPAAGPASPAHASVN